MNFDDEKLLDYVSEKILALDSETEFLVKDLFNGTEWKGLPKKERLNIGRRFKSLVHNSKIDDVVYLGKASNNSAVYKKI